MAVTINGTTGIAGTNGSAGTPAVQGADTNTGIFFPAADTIAFAEGGAEVARFDSSGNFGLGTTSPTADLSVGSTTTSSGDVHLRTTKTAVELTPSNSDAGGMNINVGFVAGGQGPLQFSIGSTERARIDASGNLLVGKTTSTGTRFEVERTDNDNSIADFKTNNGSGDVLIRSSGGYVRVRSTGTNEMAFLSAGTERARIDSSGYLLVGANTAFDNVSFTIAQFLGGIATKINNATSVTQVSFFNPNGRVGFISTNGTATTYSTSSDYRLKEDWQPMTGASERVLALKPVNFAWKVDGTRVDGFLAHEAQAVVPEAVTGTKDEVDANGNPQYQGIDQSKLVPLLTAALQEALAEIADLKTRITALEA